MKELFNFRITIQHGCVSDADVGRFIEHCLDPYGLFWGGGYNDTKIQGNVVSKIIPPQLQEIIENFVSFFNNAVFHLRYLKCGNNL